jgi:hypothetical protein
MSAAFGWRIDDSAASSKDFRDYPRVNAIPGERRRSGIGQNVSGEFFRIENTDAARLKDLFVGGESTATAVPDQPGRS